MHQQINKNTQKQNGDDFEPDIYRKCLKNHPNPSINQNEFHEVSEFQEDKLLTLSNVEGHGGGVAEGHWIHVGSHFCTLETRFTILQLQTDTNEVRKNRTEVLGPPPEPEFCALSFWNDRGSPLAPSDSVLFEKLMIF